MKPGRELDIAVGRLVMRDEGLGVLIAEYSTRIEAAWRVVEHLRGLGIGLLVKAYPVGREHTYVATVPGTEVHAAGETAPHAICRAALAAVQEVDT